MKKAIIFLLFVVVVISTAAFIGMVNSATNINNPINYYSIKPSDDIPVNTNRICGNGVCEKNETAYPTGAPNYFYCPQDCKPYILTSVTNSHNVCGNGVCENEGCKSPDCDGTDEIKICPQDCDPSNREICLKEKESGIQGKNYCCSDLKEEVYFTDNSGISHIECILNKLQEKTKILPETAFEIAKDQLGEKVSNLTIKEAESNDGPVYKVSAEREVKLFGFLPLKVQFVVSVDSTTGNILHVRKPWWSFLAVWL